MQTLPFLYVCVCVRIYVSIVLQFLFLHAGTAFPMYVCMYVCIFIVSRAGTAFPVCVCVCMYVCMYLCTHTHTHTHTHIYIYPFFHVQGLPFLHVCMYVCMYIYIHIYLHSFTCRDCLSAPDYLTERSALAPYSGCVTLTRHRRTPTSDF